MGYFLRSATIHLLNFKVNSKKAVPSICQVVPVIWKCRMFCSDNLVKPSLNIRRFFDAEKILQTYSTSESYPWDVITNYITETNPECNINSVVLNTCINLKLVEACISYYQYLKTQNNKLTPMEYYLILSTLSTCKEHIKSNCDCLQDIFAEIKHFLKTNPLLFSCAVKVYYLIEEYWTEMLKIYEENYSESKIDVVESYLAAGAFRYNNPMLGWKLIKENPLIFRKEVLISYIQYCLHMAQKGKFTPSMIDDLVLLYNKNVNIFSYPDLFIKMKELTNILNKNKYQDLVWKAKKCVVTEKGHCSHCNLNIGGSLITEEEYESLKSRVLNDIVINKNINIKTSKFELNKFLSFLETCSPYNLVIDGLNIDNLGSVNKSISLINYFKRRNMKILLIARKHLKYSKYFDFLQNNCQLFLTNNLSDDDVFFIYATLHGGLDTYFLTRDYLRGYASLLKNQEFENTFKKWQLSHQYIFTKNVEKIIPPKIHSNLPQITKSPNKGKEEFYWHLSYNENSNIMCFHHNDVNWICLSGTVNR